MAETPKKCPPDSTSPKSSPTKKEIDAATAALNHFAQGKRHLLVGDIPSAVNSLQEACRFLAEEYGETAPECGDAYYHYGQALLELARIENGVLGNALDGVPDCDDSFNTQVPDPEETTDSDQELVTTLVGKALEENFNCLKERIETIKGKGTSLDNNTKEGENTIKSSVEATGAVNPETKETVDRDPDVSLMESEISLNGTKDSNLVVEAKVEKSYIKQNEKAKSENRKREMKEDGSTEDEDEGEGEGEGEGDDGDGDGDGDGEGDGDEGEEDSQEGESQDEDGNNEENGSPEGEGEKTEEDEEEVSNLQLSWEMLELAKVIFQKQAETNPQMHKKVAQVYLKLGEVGLESENYAQGIEDFKQCLEIQMKILKEDDRCIAETHYQLGVAHSFSDDFDNAMESFGSAIQVIELRIDNLMEIKKEKESWTEEQKKKDAAEKPDPFYTEQGEIDELNELLPEIKDKITDMEQMKKDSKEKLQRAAKEAFKAQAIAGKTGDRAFGESSSSGFDAPSVSSSSSTSAAKPITHLVRKKRKAEEEPKEDPKKVKGENGEAVLASKETKNVNGNSDSMDTQEKPTKGVPDADELKKKGAAEMKTKSEEIAKEETVA